MQEIFLDEDIEQVRETVSRLVQAHVAPIAEECDENDRFPVELKEVLYDAGLLTMAVPEAYGGTGATTQALSVTLEEISRGFATMGPVLLSTFSPIKIVAAAGKEHQKRAFFSAMTAKPSIAAFCLSEPHCGSDARAMRTRAVRKEGRWVIDGQKRWITNGSVADQYLLFCRTGDGRDDISTFVVPAGAAGLSFGKKERKMGLRGGPMCDVVFDNVEVGDECLIGDAGDGWRILERIANTMRCWGAGSICLGIARAALDVAARYANERTAFGRPIGKFQAISFKLADMATGLRTAQLLVRDTNWRVDREFPDVSSATLAQVSMAKCYAADVAMKVTMEAVQVLGGYGYVREYHVERMMRDAKVFQILDGSNEVQRIVLGRHVLASAGES
jgi:alkylation response protein AidB-like acyl-CoA dehydrogenase